MTPTPRREGLMTRSSLVKWAAAGALVPLAVLALPVTASAAPPTATTVEIGGLGGTQTFPSAISSGGQVAGQSQTAAGDRHAFLWSGGVTTDLGVAPGGTFSLVSGLNDSGQVVGYGDTATGSAAFFWQAGVRTEIPTLGGGQARAAGINGSGVVIGTDITATGEQHGFLWRPARLVDLGTLLPALINDAGVVVGTVAAADGSHRIVRWENGVRTDLGTLGA